MNVSRRPQRVADEPFLQSLLLERTSQELSLDHVPAPLREQILTMQVDLRLTSVRANTADGSSEIITLDDTPAGWIFFRETEEKVHLIEVVILGAFRGRGIGGAVIGELTQRARTCHKSVNLRVNVTNERAIRLYERLGFRRTSGDEVQHEMEIPALP